MRKWAFLSLVAILLLALAGARVLASPATGAQSPLIARERFVAPEEVVDDDVIVIGGKATIEGTIRGDLIVIGPEVTINGSVEGDLLGLASRVLVRGEVRGDVRVAALEGVTIEGSVGRSLTTLTTDAVVATQGKVGTTWIAFGPTVDLRGQVGRSLLTDADRLSISGRIGGDLTALSYEEATLGPTAVVEGDFWATGKQEPVLRPGARAGAVHFTPMTETWVERFEVDRDNALEVVGFLAFGVLLSWLTPGIVTAFARRLDGHPWSTLGVGAALLIGVPAVALVLALTVAGLPVAVMLLVPLYLAAIYVGQVLVSGWVGYLILTRIRRGEPVSAISAFLLGAVITTILVRLPYVEWLASFLSMALAVGGVACVLYEKAKSKPAAPGR